MKRESAKKGLYVESEERDSCGVGMIADLNGVPTRYVVDSALKILENMEHRGASGYEINSGDGAGILIQIPDYFFRKELEKDGVRLPKKSKYGVGMFFFPKDQRKRGYCESVIKKYLQELDFEWIYTRNVEVDSSFIGETARSSEPDMALLFFKTTAFNYKSIEKRLFLLRSYIMKDIHTKDDTLIDDFYIASLSSKTIVYKGLLTANQLRDYFSDLRHPDFTSSVAIVHSRFSTNTLPKWKLAQPFRCIAHNGEINTIKGNLNWWEARESYMTKVSKERPDFIKAIPVCDPYLSDSGNFDNVVDYLYRVSRSIPHAIMMMIPEAWQNDATIPPYKKAFYEYHDAIMEPWDGPASICFTDGHVLGATLDRNGLRPSRYLLTSDNILVLGSEAGALKIDPNKIIKKGTLEPGKMLVADLDEKRIISDEEVKQAICTRKPYQAWLTKNARHINDLPIVKGSSDEVSNLRQIQLAFGMSLEDENVLLRAIVEYEKEPIGSMGSDIPLAVLSKIAQHPSHYFKQQFAQVTNPPIDPLRENFYMSLSTAIGGGSKFLGVGENEALVIRFDSPILTQEQLNSLLSFEDSHFASSVVHCTYKDDNIEATLDRICGQVLLKILNGSRIIVLSNKVISASQKAVPSLMVVGALHHFLIEKGMRKEVTITVEAGDIWEAHHVAALLSFGADLICPFLAFSTCAALGIEKKLTSTQSTEKYIKAVDKALLKIMSKLGISLLSSYKGAQTFEALGVSQEVVDKCFKGTVTRIGGLGFVEFHKENEVKHRAAFGTSDISLPDLGVFQWKRRGEFHLFNPESIHLLQYSTERNDYRIYKKFSKTIDELEKNASTLRSFLRIKNTESIPLDEVESESSILKRFATGAMSFGSISHEAHSMLAIAMNRIGGKSNSGEGGEDEMRFDVKGNGDWERSAIKQVASGRFGVNINYLNNADELQIKIAQGAKPGEGGHLPGHKVDSNIARVRNATPGVGLISPPPHHDIYSIEDLAQLIFDLKNANEDAIISVKLVSKAGVGVIASGVTKAHAEHILISGFDGGTGASPLSSIRHAGLPWELGLAETHQTLIKNGLRDRVVVQADGQIRSGRDLAIATMLGAEEWGIATAGLVVEGCIMMRKCHLNTCPVGIATQDVDLRKKFNGKVENVVNYFKFLAKDLREIMANCAVRSVNELVGRTDLLRIEGLKEHWKTANVDLTPLLFQESSVYETKWYNATEQSHCMDNVLDREIISKVRNSLSHQSSFYGVFKIQNTDRAVGTLLSSQIAKKNGSNGLPDKTIQLRFQGSAGQSFAAFASKGVQMYLEGEANDYFGKGLSGAIISVTIPSKIKINASENIVCGNVALYGATSGEAYINGIAGGRFAVRNSGATAVVEGVGDNGCEYMTGGKVIILGNIGRNFAAGMSGGIVYILKSNFDSIRLNKEMVLIEKTDIDDMAFIHQFLTNHFTYTGSKQANQMLADWRNSTPDFIKIIPKEYKAVLLKIKEKELTNNMIE